MAARGPCRARAATAVALAPSPSVRRAHPGTGARKLPRASMPRLLPNLRLKRNVKSPSVHVARPSVRLTILLLISHQLSTYAH